MLTIAEKINKVRTTLDLNMDEFGKRVGVGLSYISQIESGNKTPSARLETAILREFRISHEWWNAGIEPIFRPADDKPDPADLAILASIKASPEKYLAMKELAKIDDEDVFGVRAEIRRAMQARKNSE